MKTNQRIFAGLLAALQVFTPTLSWAQSAPTTYITYDEVGQTKQVTSPAGRTRQLQWDAVGRLASETRSGATVGYGYNGQDTLTSVTDPRNLGTTYDRNGFGEARSQNSPDTAASTFGHDLNGNLTSRVNAAGQTESYAYDAANRVTSKTVSHPTQGPRTYTFIYGANGTAEAGNLTQVSATGMALNFTHNLFGQTTSASQALLGNATLATGYAYAANGTPTSITYPSGRVVTYTLDGASRVTGISSAGTPLLSGITYSPLGALAGWTFGSGQAVTRTYDLNGRITGISMPTGTRQYVYDVDDRIVGINDPVLGTATYGYDDLDRLTSASTSVGSWTYQYDATGNRIGHSGGASSTTVSIDNTSNRVLATSGAPSRLYTYTNDGHARLVDGAAPQLACGSSVSMSFQADGQMVSSNVLSAVHSPSGLRLQKSAAACAGGTTTNFVYDLAGHLIGEYDGSGAVVQETVWMGDVPVAVFKPSVAATPFYIYADNLGSPRAITNSSAQLVWQWDGEPFGATAANSNPTGLGDFGYNVRFPGQYLDVETGYHHNGWREYDPAVGRYVQSDPIGLAGGINTYLYADGDPLGRADPTGQATGVGSAMIALDVLELSKDLATGNYVAAAFDVVALGIDLVPGVPEVAGASLRVGKGAVKAICKVSREDRWVQLAQEANSRLSKQVVDYIGRHRGKGVQKTFGLDLAHPPKRSAAQGYDYSEALPKLAADHRGIQHRYLRESKNGTVITTQPKPRNGGKLDLPPEGALP